MSRFVAQWDEKKSDIVFKEIKDKDFYKERKENEQIERTNKKNRGERCQ